ncbi:GNAT family N-acetyltransferase [Colwellia sp. PAMC 21821]|uniref:GNAT family N-acetyltransferase n=1 Tax=Colwellia sp. PAMC 21821 TaxID=1816219 RepID=UPI0009C1705A|nr:GNAT family N-acetyltransferase [Colwellia sp. PAMC 21821]ARD44067.1 GCN5 family acetyltransferase [Colwellia sp. PAMC 21821]
MKIEVIENPELELIAFLDAKIAEFNWAHWEVSERKAIAVKLNDENGDVIAGAAGRTFGDWLMINTLWVSDTLRGQQVGSKILHKMEQAAKARGCNKALLDTLNFQAMPFYEKHGYQVQWTQQGYPKTGCRYYMMKQLSE